MQHRRAVWNINFQFLVHLSQTRKLSIYRGTKFQSEQQSPLFFQPYPHPEPPCMTNPCTCTCVVSTHAPNWYRHSSRMEPLNLRIIVWMLHCLENCLKWKAKTRASSTSSAATSPTPTTRWRNPSFCSSLTVSYRNLDVRSIRNRLPIQSLYLRLLLK